MHFNCKSPLIYIKSLLFCLRYLPFSQAIRIPILVGLRFHITKLKKGGVVIKANEIKRGMISLGVGGTQGVISGAGELFVENDGQVIFHGHASIASGCSIRIDKGARLNVGNNLITLNKNSFIKCSTSITIGENVLIGWNVTINDNDGHHIIEDGSQRGCKGPIVVGDHVWICSNACICKNVKLPDNSVVAQSSIVTKSFTKGNVLIAGIPAKIVKYNINWVQ